jgi:lysozyme
VIPDGLAPLIKQFEGFSRVIRWRPVPAAVPYVCPAGYWTRGYGVLCTRDAGEITEPDASTELERLLPVYVAHALRLSPRLSGRPLVAIGDFLWNLGPTRYASSTLRRRVNEADWPAARVEIQKWKFGGGRVLPGLVLRRAAEAAML